MTTHMDDKSIDIRKDQLILCPKRPILICTDKNGKEVPLNSTSAVRQITRFGKCLGPMCKFYNTLCKGESDG